MTKIDSDDVADYLIEYSTKTGYSPSVRDLADQFEVSTSTIHRHLQSLIRDGRVKAAAGHARTWRIVTG